MRTVGAAEQPAEPRSRRRTPRPTRSPGRDRGSPRRAGTCAPGGPV